MGSSASQKPSGVELGYARVSTTRQSLERQFDALGAQGIPAGRIYAGKKTGATADREGLQKMLAYARPGRHDRGAHPGPDRPQPPRACGPAP